MRKFHWNPRRWLHEHSLKLLAIRDTPEAIAGGVAIGIFFGFTPLFGLKTLSAIFVAWLTGSNILAAVIAGTLHDVILPFMPAIYLWEYNLGFWLLNYEWPRHVALKAELQTWRSWTFFITVGKPMLLGSAVCGGPVSALTFLIARRLVARHQRKKQAQVAPPLDPGANPT
jgi:uncharacterized protein (DUF2062 family)